EAGGSTTLTVSNLAEGVTYYFTSTDYDTNGFESIFSAEVFGMISLPNQPPTLNSLVNLTINENAGLQTVNLSGISSGATNEAQVLTVTAISSNPALIPPPMVNYSSPNTTGGGISAGLLEMAVTVRTCASLVAPELMPLRLTV